MVSKSERETDNGMWLIQPSHLNVNKSGSVLTGRKHSKIVRPGDGCLKIGRLPTNPGDLADIQTFEDEIRNP